MNSLLVALPGLGCAAMMAGMMWLMSRGTKADQGASSGNAPADPQAELTDLRAEVDRLRAEVRAPQSESGPTP
jgi:hypothetical protein